MDKNIPLLDKEFNEKHWKEFEFAQKFAEEIAQDMKLKLKELAEEDDK